MTIARVAELAELARAIVVASTLHVSLPLGFLKGVGLFSVDGQGTAAVGIPEWRVPQRWASRNP